MFLIQLPGLNNLFVNTITNTSIPYKLMITAIFVLISSYTLNNMSFKYEKDILALFSTLFVYSLVFMFLTSIFTENLIIIAFVLYMFIDFSGFIAASRDNNNAISFEWVSAVKKLLMIIYALFCYFYFV